MATQRNREPEPEGRHVGAYEAKTHLSSLLDDVERGEVIIITRRGVPIARLTPIVEDPLQRTRRVVARLKELQQEYNIQPASTEEIVGWIREGRDQRGDQILNAVAGYRRGGADAERS